MDIKKIVEIPVPNYLYKFLKYYEKEKEKVIDIPFHLPTPLSRHEPAVVRYFQFAQYKKYRKIKVLAVRENYAHCYGVKRLFDLLFYTNLYAFINAHVKSYFQIKQAIQLFCNQYGITEEDYKMETFVKKYQRYRKRPKHTQLFL